MLLVKRRKPPRAGEWSLPGGGQELGETVAEAARRELAEETGLAPAHGLVLLDVIDSIDRDADGTVLHHHTLIDFAAEAAEGEARAGDDAAAIAWAPLDSLEAFALWPRTLAVIAQAARLPRPIRGS